MLFRFLRTVRAVKPVLVHSSTIKPNIYAGFCKRASDYALVATVPGMGEAFSGSGLFSRIKHKVSALLYRLALNQNTTLVLCENSEDLALAKAVTKLPSSRVRLIPGAGVDPNVYECLPEAPASNNFVVLFAARLYRNKGLHVLVNAVEKLRSKGLRTELWVAGLVDPDASDVIPESQLLEWANDGLIRWLGAVDRMPDVLQKVHVVCLPSLAREGLPRILLEAMSCGRPIVTTNVPGCKELVNNHQCGLLVPPGDSTALADALELLFNDVDSCNSMGRRGRVAVENIYSSNNVINSTLQTYSELMAGDSSHEHISS